jgi:hypothetical protein
MNFSQLHERLRIDIARRIDRGQLTGTLLARQTGLRSSHISNFIRRNRRLSMAALDRVLASQLLSVEDLLPETRRAASDEDSEGFSTVPVVAYATALHSPAVGQRSTLELIRLPGGILENLRPRRTLARRSWQRFVAVRLTPSLAAPMEPLLSAGSVTVLDRHYCSLAPNHPGRRNIYAVNVSNNLVFRHVSYEANRLILRPHALNFPVELLKLGADESPSSSIIGRVCVVIAEL